MIPATPIAVDTKIVTAGMMIVMVRPVTTMTDAMMIDDTTTGGTTEGEEEEEAEEGGTMIGVMRIVVGMTIAGIKQEEQKESKSTGRDLGRKRSEVVFQPKKRKLASSPGTCPFFLSLLTLFRCFFIPSRPSSCIHCYR